MGVRQTGGRIHFGCCVSPVQLREQTAVTVLRKSRAIWVPFPGRAGGSSKGEVQLRFLAGPTLRPNAEATAIIVRIIRSRSMDGRPGGRLMSQ
jgi:hypothetical protein